MKQILSVQNSFSEKLSVLGTVQWNRCTARTFPNLYIRHSIVALGTQAEITEVSNYR